MAKILYVEDDPIAREAVIMWLELAGFEVDLANDGLEGVEKAIAGRPDIILMDLQMPIMNGFEATAEIKKLYPNVPIVVQTAYTIDEEREKSKKAGCDGFISKPIKPVELFAAISIFILAQYTR